MTATTRSARPHRMFARLASGAVLTAGVFVALAVPAFAETAEDPAAPLGLAKTLGLFVGVPVAAFALIALLVTAPRLMKRSRGEDDLGWYRDATTDAAATDTPEGTGATAPALTTDSAITTER